MKLPRGIDLGMIGLSVVRAVARDHGDPVITRAWHNAFTGLISSFEIGGISYDYANDGTLIDAHRFTRPRWGCNAKRIEVDHRDLPVRPVEIEFNQIQPGTFLATACAVDRKVYAGIAGKTVSAYEVLGPQGYLGKVAQIRHTPREAADKPLTQWYAMGSDGAIWSGYGRTREEAARWLLSDAAAHGRLPRAA